jgi:hypothetical protein
VQRGGKMLETDMVHPGWGRFCHALLSIVYLIQRLRRTMEQKSAAALGVAIVVNLSLKLAD